MAIFVSKLPHCLYDILAHVESGEWKVCMPLIIGATSHYVTVDLDAGPIIEQDVVRVSHKDTVEDLLRKGQKLEKVVLSRAIWARLQRNILVYGNRTVVFI